MVKLKAKNVASADGFSAVLAQKLSDLDTYGYAMVVITDWIDMVEDWPVEVKDTLKTIITDIGVTVDIRGLSPADKTDFRAKFQQIQNDFASKSLQGIEIDNALLLKLAAVIRK